ncbi:MAG TPA: LysR family transcriptional regulator [Candidatus Aphodovivens avistercoris]|nr:LysR family transcriptional regulator [Candidatus Aphodovivens avistercoris]
MQLAQLNYLHAVIAEGSYAAAARVLYVTPQAVSKALIGLERELGLPLFERTGRAMAPTEFARALDEQAEELRDGLDDLAAFVSGYAMRRKASGSLRLALTEAPHRGRLICADDLAPFLRDNPALHLSLLQLSNESCASAVENGMLDAAVVLGKVHRTGVVCRRVTRVRPCAAMARQHPLAGKRWLRLTDLDGQRVARPLDGRCALSLLTERCVAAGVKPRISWIGASLDERDGFLRDGGIVLVARGSGAEEGLSDAAVLPFHVDERFTLPLYLVYREECAANAEALYACLAQVAKREQGRF